MNIFGGQFLELGHDLASFAPSRIRILLVIGLVGAAIKMLSSAWTVCGIGHPRGVLPTAALSVLVGTLTFVVFWVPWFYPCSSPRSTVFAP